MDSGNEYDWVIVGGGPVGLTLAWLLSQEKDTKGILIIEREFSLGGCHRVRRVTTTREQGRGQERGQEQGRGQGRELGLFTEHGPRIYSNAYVNTRQVLSSLGMDFEKVFVPYKFTTGSMGTSIVGKISIREFLLLALEFFKVVVNPDHGRDITVAEFTESNNFSEASRQELDRACRLTDGAGADRYTVLELLSIIDQHLFYKFYLPREPNDLGLFSTWQDKLQQTGKVSFLLGKEVTEVIYEGRGNRVRGVRATDVANGSDTDLYIPARRVVLAIPPENALPLLSGVVPDPRELSTFERRSRYDAYIPVAFHWDRKLELPNVWGFPDTPWGVISMLLSDYMKFRHPWSKTMISTCTTLPNEVSLNTGLTANQTASREEFVEETFRQLNKVYGGILPRPTASVMSPGAYYDMEKQKWQTADSAFVLTPAGFMPDQKISGVEGLYWVGSHNGRSPYNFTAFESAVTNALAFYLENIPGAAEKGEYKILSPVSLSAVIRYVVILGLLAYLVNKYVL